MANRMRMQINFQQVQSVHSPRGAQSGGGTGAGRAENQEGKVTEGETATHMTRARRRAAVKGPNFVFDTAENNPL